MPRDRKNSQPAQAQASQSYGEKTDQLQAQAAMPIPRNAPTGPPQGQAAPAPPSAGAPAGGGGEQVDPRELLLQQAQAFDPGITPLTANSMRPGEPVTAGLRSGPGPGPEIFEQPTRKLHAADTMALIGQVTGDDKLLQMADTIRRAGGFA
jgi:hypothetical protein